MSRLFKTMITSIILLLVIVIVVLVILLNESKEEEVIDHINKVPVEKIQELSYEMPEITTDLKDGSFVRIQFQIVTNTTDAQKEVSKREFQLKNILIKELAQMEEEDFKSDLTKLEDTLRKKINDIIEDGEVLEVLTTTKILQ